MASYEDGGPPASRPMPVGRDAYVAGRDLHVHLTAPGEPGQAAEAARRVRAGEQEPAYLATVRVIRDRTRMLAGRQEELAEIAAFAVGGDGYRWVAGEPWAGKTSLLAEAAMSMPAEVDVVCYFLSRREGDADGSRFLAAVVPQLSALGAEDPPVADVHQFRALWRRAGSRADRQRRHLLLIVDGLDEDLRPPGLASIAALLPAEAGGRIHVLVSSRFHPEMPGDVPAGHPLRQVRPTLLEPYAGARETALLAQQEIENLLPGERADGLAADVLSLLAAAGGPLAVPDLAALVGDGTRDPVVLARRIRALLTVGAARSVQPAGQGRDSRYQFAHESLLAYAQAHPDLNDPSFRNRVHQWAERWQAAGWPAADSGSGTPRYLLDTYPATLAREPARLARLAGDIGWVEAAITSAGVDTALATIRQAAAAIPESAPVAAVLAAVAGQAYNLRSFCQPGFVLRQLWMQAAELGSGGMPAAGQLAAEIRRRLQLPPGPALVPRWTTRRTSQAISGELGRHGGFIRAMEVLADGTLAVADDDRVLIWDPARPGAGPVELGGDRTEVTEVVTADGRVIAAQPRGRPLIRDPARPEAGPAEFGGWGTPRSRHQNPLELALPGGHVVKTELTGTLRVYDPDGRWRGCEPGVVTALAALPDGRGVIGMENGSVGIWDLDTPEELPVELGRLDDQVSAIAVLPDGRIATGSYDGRVLLWDIGTPGRPAGAPGHAAGASAACFSGDGRLVTATGGAVVSWDWDLDGPRRQASVAVGGSAHALALLPDQRVAIAGPYNKVQVWDPACRAGDRRRGGVVVVLGHVNGDHATGAAVLPDGRIATSGYDAQVVLWDPDHPAVQPTRLRFTNRRLLAVAVLPDGRVVSGGTDGRVLAWNPAEPRADPVVIGRHDGPVRVVATLPDGRILTGGWDDGRVLIWDAGPPRPEPLELGRHNGHVLSAAALSGGLVATAGSDSRVYIWTPAAAGTPVLQLDCPVQVIAAQHSQAASDLLVAHKGGGFSLWSFTR